MQCTEKELKNYLYNKKQQRQRKRKQNIRKKEIYVYKPSHPSKFSRIYQRITLILLNEAIMAIYFLSMAIFFGKFPIFVNHLRMHLFLYFL